MKNSRLALPTAVWGWLAGSLAWRGLVATLLPTGFDEVYYSAYSRHLHWSYFDHPPLVALTTGLGWWSTGLMTPLTLRLGALGLYTLSQLLLYWVALRLFDQRTGELVVAITTLAPLLWLAFGVLAAPDNALISGWTLTVLIAVAEFLPSRPTATVGPPLPDYRPSWRIVLLGLSLGIACLSKYHGFVLGLGLVGFCLSCDRYRRALWSPWTALSLLVFGGTLAPLIYWNAQHDWISFQFHLGLRFQTTAPSPYRLWGAVGTWLLGVGYLFPTIGLPLWWQTGRSLLLLVSASRVSSASPAAVWQRHRTALILWVSLPVALGFTLLGGQQAIYPAWPAPGFWGLTLLLAAAARCAPSRWVHRWLTGTALVIAALVMVALLHLSLGVLQKPGQYSLFGGLVPVAEDGSTALLQTGQLRSRMAEAPDLTQALATVAFIFTDEFYLSAYVEMALQPLTSLPITCFSQDPRGYAFWWDPNSWIGQDALYLTLASLHPNRTAPMAEFQPYFADLEPIQTIPLTRGGVMTDTVWIYRASRLQRPYGYPYGYTQEDEKQATDVSRAAIAGSPSARTLLVDSVPVRPVVPESNHFR